MKCSKPILFRKKRKLRAAQLRQVYAALRRTFGHQRWWPGETPFEVMVGAILTQNTAWTNVEKAILNLKRAKALSFKALRKISRKELARLIRPAGYFNVKADRLKCFIDFLDRECGGDLRRLMREPASLLRQKLLSVKGIGPETADSILLYALNKKSFVIDAYTKRIFSRHGLARDHEDYEWWRELFTRALPEDLDLYNDYHAQIVRLGKEYCRKSPYCGSCPLRRFF
ncbi:MAG TPA: endonuclease III domain-containing protein [Candidatus Omnitrophota bacterium]|nr:endonuclease III domain-containing protein [Candidatus Omnitrophota bacterium]HRY85757.1 endonuclease III domain-containing protein [Candidatus Omnitrophota bacterium]